MRNSRGVSRASNIRLVGSRAKQTIDYEGSLASGWWIPAGIDPVTAIGAYRSKGAVSYESSLVNLASPGVYDLTAVDISHTPSWDVDLGWTGDGTDDYLDTGIIPKSKNYSVFVRMSGNSERWGKILYANGAAGFGFWQTSSAVMRWVCSSYYATTAVLIESGVLCMSFKVGYTDGVANGATGTGYLVPTTSFQICGQGTDFFDGNIQAVAIYHSILSAEQVLAVSNEMAAL